MLASIKAFKHFSLSAVDGDIGSVKDFLFDDREWQIRYMVAESGNWLTGRKVLIAPHSLERPNWEAEKFPVTLTKESIKESPRIEEDAPVSMQTEIALSEFFHWPYYWNAGLFSTPGVYNNPDGPEEIQARMEEMNPHLRSANEVVAYSVQTSDNCLSKINDIMIKSDEWHVRYFIVDTGEWLPGKKVLLTPDSIKDIRAPQRIVVIDLKKAELEQLPEYHPDQPIGGELQYHQ